MAAPIGFFPPTVPAPWPPAHLLLHYRMAVSRAAESAALGKACNELSLPTPPAPGLAKSNVKFHRDVPLTRGLAPARRWAMGPPATFLDAALPPKTFGPLAAHRPAFAGSAVRRCTAAAGLAGIMSHLAASLPQPRVVSSCPQCRVGHCDFKVSKRPGSASSL